MFVASLVIYGVVAILFSIFVPPMLQEHADCPECGKKLPDMGNAMRVVLGILWLPIVVLLLGSVALTLVTGGRR